MAGGKIAYEVGFDKIRAQLAQLSELKIVIVDGMKVVKAETEDKKIREVCPKIVELDLSRNLFQSWEEIIKISAELDNLKSLTLRYTVSLRMRNLSLTVNSGNRFVVPDYYELFGGSDPAAEKAFTGITELRLNEMLIGWGETCNLANQFSSLSILDVSSNQLESMYDGTTNASLQVPITSLKLEHNAFERLDALSPLTKVTSLKSLHLKNNNISRTCTRYQLPIFDDNLEYVDLSYNAIDSWAFIDALNHIFPGMTSLRISHNPIMESIRKASDKASAVDETFMLVVARLPKLTNLNFSNISEADRTQAEMFYLSQIAKEMAAYPEELEGAATHGHKRYAELCEIYGKPSVLREDHSDNPNFLESRLIDFTFHMPKGTKKGMEEDIVMNMCEIPKTWDTYRIKGYVGKLFDYRPLGLRLIWETGEWDPVAGYEDLQDESEEDEASGVERKDGEEVNKGKFMQREVEIEDGTRQVGFLINDKKAKVRVEII